MTIKELYQAARLRVRKSAKDDLDLDIKRHVDAAVEDLKRIGVRQAWLDDPFDPLIIEAVLSYVRANYSIDTSQYGILAGVYDMNIIRIKGNHRYFTEDPERKQVEEESGSEGGSIAPAAAGDMLITLIHPADRAENDLKTDVFAASEPVGRDEFQAAGVNGYKATAKLEVWAAEYDNQPEVIIAGKRLTIYRTYGPRPDGKIELYTAERVGNYGR